MGNSQVILSDVDILDLKETTPFTDSDLKRLEKRYSDFDKSDDGSTGITYDDMLMMPEFVGNEFASQIIAGNLDERTQKVYAKQFVQIFGILSPKTKAEEKKEFLFEIFNIYGTGILTHDELFRIYKTIFSHAISDDHIVALTFRALNHPSLKNKGQITKPEFLKMIPDHEITNRMNIEI